MTILNSFLIFCAISLISACEDTKQAHNQRNAAEHLVNIVPAEYQIISIKQTIPSTLQAYRQVKIINQIPGLLIKMPVYPGDKVQKGQLLASIDDTLFKAEMQKAEATLKQTTVDLRRLQDLAPRKLASESEIAQAQTLKQIAIAELTLKQTTFSHTKITAPFDGVISKRFLEAGDVLPLHTQILGLIDNSQLKARVELSELLLPLIKIGNQVDIQIDALGQEKYAGYIKRIYPVIDQDTRRATIEIILKTLPENALVGQFCRISIYTQSKKRLVIPYNSVKYDKQGAYIYQLFDDKAVRKNIIIGIQQDNLVEVLSGINEHDQIIFKGFLGLKDQMKVKNINSIQSNSNE